MKQFQKGNISDQLLALAGVLIGCALLLSGLVLTPGAPLELALIGVGMLLGGTLAASLVSMSFSELLELILYVQGLLSSRFDADKHTLVQQTVRLAAQARELGKPQLARKLFEKERKTVAHPMLKEGLGLVVGGYTPDMLHDALSAHVQSKAQRSTAHLKTLETLSGYFLHFGLLSSLIALMSLMQAGFESDLIRSGVYMSFIPTVVGAVGAFVVLEPLSQKLSRLAEQEHNVWQMAQTATELLQARHHALYIEGILNAYLPPELRMSYLNSQGELKTKSPPKEAPPAEPKATSGAFQEAVEAVHEDLNPDTSPEPPDKKITVLKTLSNRKPQP